jgi:hypothetical protein
MAELRLKGLLLGDNLSEAGGDVVLPVRDLI